LEGFLFAGIYPGRKAFIAGKEVIRKGHLKGRRNFFKATSKKRGKGVFQKNYF